MKRKRLWISVGAAVAAAGLVAGCSTSSPSTSSPSATSTAPASTGQRPGPAGGAGGGNGSNARSAAAEGGAAGTVDSVTSSGLTLTTSAGQKVTVTTTSSTAYLNGTSKTSASTVTNGTTVLALGTANGTTIAATQIVVQASDGGSAASTAAGVVPFQQGAQSAAKQDGQIPANYTEGQGTIVSGTTADKATAAALAAYPGGVVDRVVQLSGGEYEVHYIGVNWPHHIFVDTTYKVVGAN
jgi:hypothetical protein